MKFIAKKIIHGKAYLYLQHNKKSTLLGRSIPFDIRIRMLNFFEKLYQEGQQKTHPEIQKYFPYGNDYELLEKLHGRFICLSQSDFFYEDYVSWQQKFAILFTYHSNRSEGSKTSQEQIERFSFAKKRTASNKTEREILNSFNALEYAFSPKMKWQMKDILHIHYLLLKDIDPLIAGMWKKEENIAPGNQPTTKSKEVKSQIKELLLWLKNANKHDIYPPLIALWFYIKFEKIHPFLDGNGRVGRILLNAILKRFDYMPIIFFTQNHQKHCAAITKAIAGDCRKFSKHLVEQAEKTEKALIQ